MYLVLKTGLDGEEASLLCAFYRGVFAAEKEQTSSRANQRASATNRRLRENLRPRGSARMATGQKRNKRFHRGRLGAHRRW